MADTRDELLAAFRELADLYPDWRFTQMVSNVASWAGALEPGEQWDLPDAKMLKAAREHLSHRRRAGTKRRAAS